MGRFFDVAAGAFLGMALTMWASQLGIVTVGVPMSLEIVISGFFCLVLGVILYVTKGRFLTLLERI